MEALDLNDETTKTIIESYKKEIKKLTEERDRFKTIAYNAICLWREESFYEYDEDDWKEHVMAELDIYSEEYDEIME